LQFFVPVDGLIDEIRRAFEPAFRTCRGFERFYLVLTAPDRATAIIVRETAAAAQEDAAVIGPGVFNRVIVPRLAGEQDRVSVPRS
jgi:hypothetical protein